MKKNISINISGIIFHIEEDGYDALRKYLDSINSYFGSFEDSSEILADIESRIAEIFLSKLNEGKQVITSEDVQGLIATMGSVNDFKAAEDQEGPVADTQHQGAGGNSERSSSAKKSDTRKFARDQRRKILGGVCAGLGHYFNVDPVWPRLIFALVFFATSGILLLVYIVLWIALPVSDEIEDESNIKKMFRDTDNKVVGGVASGVAAFFGADVTVIRVLFVVLSFLFGTGFLVYIVLWIVLPEAKTITDKMKMQGEPVTLSNIESSIKKGLNEKDAGPESTLAKIILFPFRMIAALLTGLANILGPIFRVTIDVMRIAIGFAIASTGVMLLIFLIFFASIWFGMVSIHAIPEWKDLHSMNLPFEQIRLAFPTWGVIVSFVAAAVPALFVLLIGISIIAKRIVFHPIAGWTLFVLFFVSLAYLGITIPRVVYSFKEDGEFKIEKNFTTNGKIPFLKLREAGLDDYHMTDLRIRGYEGTEIKLVERFTAQGPTKLNARENAQGVDYVVEQSDSTITFDSNITFKKDAKFRFQRLDLDLYFPYDQPFVIDHELWSLIENHWQNEYNGQDQLQKFKMNKQNRLECITCPPPEKDMSGLRGDDQFGLKDFNEIDMTGAFDVTIQRGDEYAIQLVGDEAQKKNYTFDVRGETLEVVYNTRTKEFWKNSIDDQQLVKLTITMPSLRKLKATGAGKMKIRDFDEQEIKISLTGAMEGDARLSANQMSVDINGTVVFEIDGHGDFLEASVTGPSQFKATNFPVNRAIIEAHGLAQARVNVSQNLEIEKDFTSNVHYTGNPQVTKRD